MILDNFRDLMHPGENTSVVVADVQRIRRQRRQAQTEDEHANVRAHMRILAGNLKGKTSSNAAYLKNIGIALIIIGLIVGIAMFFVAGLAWPYYLEFLDS